MGGCRHTKCVVCLGRRTIEKKLEISHTSHPFYTGKIKLVDTVGRVDRFRSRYGKKEEELLKNEQLKNYLEENMKTEKAIKFIVENAKIK